MRPMRAGRVFFPALFMFLAMGGGTATAAYVVSSNGQIGPNTVSGHRLRGGHHSNLIPGTVSARDLAPASVTGSELATGSVDSAKVRNGSLKAIDLATPVRLPTGCSSDQVPKWTAAGWACATNPFGSAGGALSGTYPDPALDVSGGPCANGQALTDISAQAALTCKPAVYSDADSNVAAGPSPFGALTGGQLNVAVGPSMLTHDTTGSRNMALGQEALRDNTTGDNNAGVGSAALRSNTTGDFNAAMGNGALVFNTTGTQNTAVGNSAMVFNTTGSNNTALGHDAGSSLVAGNANVDIANSGLAGDSNTIRIGTQGTQTQAFMAGVSGTAVAGSPVVVDNNGQLGTTSSSRRFKEDIHPIGSERRGLLALKPVSFRYKRSVVDGHSAPQFGLIAEQVAKVYPNLVVNGKDGRPSAVAYQELPALELAQLKHEHAKLRGQAQRNRAQAEQIQAQRSRLRSQGKQIATLRRAVARLSKGR